MKITLLFIVLVTLFLSCSSKHQIEKALHSGNYDQAIEDALQKLKNNKHKNRKQDFVVMLEDAYYKAVDRDLNDINHLKKEENPENYKVIYDLYLDMNERQEAIKATLPLKIGGKILNLRFQNYSNDILTSRNNLANYMYGKGLTYLESNNKQTIRDAYYAFKYIEQIYPNYIDTRSLMDDALQRGTDFVIIKIENQTNQIIPKPLHDDLLSFDVVGLNQQWTVYHANADDRIDYDYAMVLQLKSINISAEELHEKQLLKEKQIVDGWKYQLDNNGNVIKDTLGNDIKVDNIINVRARYFEFNQFKSTHVVADVVCLDLKQHQKLDAFPIDNHIVFENRFATVRGDKRALDLRDLELLDHKRIIFPLNEQMVFAAGEGLKSKLKNILRSYKIAP